MIPDHDGAARLADAGVIAAMALADWCDWHARRGEARGIVTAKAPLESVAAIAAAIANMMEAGACHAVVDLVSDALHRAIDDAKEAAEGDIYGTNGKIREFFQQQSEEIETSQLRSYARRLDDINELLRCARDNPEQGRRWHLEYLHSCEPLPVAPEDGQQ